MKKRIFNIIAIAALSVGAVSCNDEFLERYPKASVTEANAFKTYETCTAYLQNLYAIFGNTYLMGPATVSGAMGSSQRDVWSGLLTNYGAGLGNVNNPYAAQNVIIPTTDGTYSNPYVFIRRANLLLSHIDEVECTDDQRLYLEGVGRFFRALAHFTLLHAYGDITYVDHLLTDESEELQAPRDSRLYVADQIYNELDWCIKNMPDKVSDANTIKPDVVKALMSRFTLFEGTWRKYHAVNETECAANGWKTGSQLLEACATVSKEVIDAHPNLYTGVAPDNYPGRGWGQLWTTDDLGNVDEVLLYVKFVRDYKMHRMGHFQHIASASLDLPQSTIDLYLTKDGLPIHNAAVKYYDYVGVGGTDETGLYVEGDPYDYANADIYKTFRKRDPRMWQTVIPPYNVILVGANGYRTHPATSKFSEYIMQLPARGKKVAGTENEYLIRTINAGPDMSDPHKGIPSGNWGGNTLYNVPTVMQTNKSAAQTPDGNIGLYSNKPFQRGRSGYFFWKHHAVWDQQDQNNAKEVSDKPLFKVSEVMLNYAEVMWELGKFNQTVADATINKLRDRAGVGRMDFGAIDSNFDPDRDPTVDPVLWEIRRERLIELMGESFSYDDVRRWKKADWYVNKQHYGIFVENASAVLEPVAGLATGILNPATKREYTKAELEAAGNKGHLYYYADPKDAGKGWLEKYYLEPIPSDEILLNPNLEQQELWK